MPTWVGEQITYETGTGPRYKLTATKEGEPPQEVGGNAVSPLYEPQATRLIEVATTAGYSVVAEIHRSSGESSTEQFEPSA